MRPRRTMHDNTAIRGRRLAAPMDGKRDDYCGRKARLRRVDQGPTV